MPGGRVASPHADLPDRVALVIAPGFSGGAHKPGVRRAIAAFVEHADVIQVDLRGHGLSGGRSTMSDREVLDIDAAVARARSLGYRRVVTIGFSMGGSAVLRHAALVGEDVHGHRLGAPVDAVVSVSTGSVWHITDTKPVRRLRFLVMNPVGRIVARRAFAVRVDPAGWTDDALSPLEAAARIAVPRLVVQGDSDHYLTAGHGDALAGSGAGPVQLWAEQGFGHAEEGASDDLLHRIAVAAVSLADNGRVASTRTVTVRYWAAARDAAGCASEELSGATLGEVLEAAVRLHGGELERLLGICSYLVDGTPVQRAAATDHVLPAGTAPVVVEILPPFAGGA